MLNSGVGIFFAPNANITPIDFANRIKSGLITKRDVHKTLLRVSLAYYHIVSAFACHLPL